MQQTEFQWGPPARVVTAAGPACCESLLLRRLDGLFEGLGPEILKRPIRLVVPSKSLRRHILERILAHRGRAVAGLDCRTHHGLAVTITQRAGQTAAIPTDLFPLFARRLAHQETPLRRTLEHLNDGYASILASVSDLLDAGLDEAHAEALEEALETEGPKVATAFEIERAKSLVRVAARTSSQLAEQSLGRSSHLLQAATALIKQDPDLLPSSAVLVYGYNDATGLTTDFLLALVQTVGGEFLLDDPPDPIDPAVADSGVRFARNYRERLAATLPHETEPAIPATPELELFRANGAEAEVREAGRRIRRLIGGGVHPERIGVVCRRLTSYRHAVRVQFDRLGLPFSGIARSGPAHPNAFRVSAVVELLKQRDQLPLERWLDASSLSAGLRNDLELGLHALGIARLKEAAELDVERFLRTAGGETKRGLPLPIRTGFDVADGTARASRRYLAKSRIEDAAETARALTRRLSEWSRHRTLGAHLGALRSLLADDLGWSSRSELSRDLLAELDAWSTGIADSVEIDFHEFATLLAHRLEAFGATDLGGGGGGVQILDAVEARSRTFEHLFILGLNRGEFPRVVKEDPLLPDRLREVISGHGFGVLPDLQRKLPGFDEERYLFAQLFASSPRVVASWLEVDDDHAFRTPSPLIERIRWSLEDPKSASHETWREPVTAPPVLAPDQAAGPGESARPAFESAIVTGVYGARDQFVQILELAEQERAERYGTEPAADDLAGIRLRVLEEIDPVRGTETGETVYASLGPYLGMVGPPIDPADPRNRARLFVTTLEQIARCPWRAFLEKVLRIETLPDPLEVLPGVSPLLIGNLVHLVLEEIAEAGLASSIETLDEARTAPGRTVPWPSEKELSEMLRTNARRVAFDQGITLPGFDRVLAEVCARHVEIARELDWTDAGSRFAVLASELRGELQWGRPAATIAFKADRVDRNAGHLVLTDYKTGKGLTGGRFRRSERKLLLDAVQAGERLQAAVYARAGGGAEDVGRYLFLGPSLEEGVDRDVVVRGNDDDVARLLDRALAATLGVWRTGAFIPRLAEHNQNVEPSQCGFCDVAEACVRGDSGARGRLRSWADRRHPAAADPPRTQELETAALRTWFLRDSDAWARPAEEDR